MITFYETVEVRRQMSALEFVTHRMYETRLFKGDEYALDLYISHGRGMMQRVAYIKLNESEYNTLKAVDQAACMKFARDNHHHIKET